MGAKLGSLSKNQAELEKVGAKLAEQHAREGDRDSDQGVEDEPLALGGFRPARETLDVQVETDAPEKEKDIGTAATRTMPKSDPPEPEPQSLMVPPPAPIVAVPVNGTVDPAQNDELSASMQVEALAAIDQNKVVTADAPVVDPASVPKPPRDFNTGERDWFASEPKDDSETSAPASEPPPPFETERLTDSGPTPTGSVSASPAPVSTPPATVAAVPAAPRPNHQRVAMPPATPARLFWVNYRPRIILATVFAALGLMALSGGAGYTYALRSLRPAVSGDSIAVPSDVVTTEVSEASPVAPAVPVVEGARLTRPVMPPHSEPVAPSEPGLVGSSGTYVRTLARTAFPRSCATAGRTPIPGVRFFCERDARHGDDYCACDVAGFIP
jgi:hypothetical protein